VSKKKAGLYHPGEGRHCAGDGSKWVVLGWGRGRGEGGGRKKKWVAGMDLGPERLGGGGLGGSGGLVQREGPRVEGGGCNSIFPRGKKKSTKDGHNTELFGGGESGVWKKTAGGQGGSG